MDNDPARTETIRLHGKPVERPDLVGFITFVVVGVVTPFAVVIIDLISGLLGHRILARGADVMNIFPLFGLLAGIGAYIVAKKMRDKWWERYGEALKRFNEKHPDA